MEGDLAEAWRRSGDATLRLLDAIPEEALGARYAPRTRTAAAQFAHVHSVRVYQLDGRGKRFLGDLRSFPRGAEPGRAEIRAALVASGEAVAAMLAACEAAGRVSSWRGPPATFLAYLVAHEAHHRGLALAALRVAGAKAPPELAYGLWDLWSKERGPAPAAAKKGRR